MRMFIVAVIVGCLFLSGCAGSNYQSYGHDQYGRRPEGLYRYRNQSSSNFSYRYNYYNGLRLRWGNTIFDIPRDWDLGRVRIHTQGGL